MENSTSVNDFLFSNNKKDFYSYFNKLKVYSTTAQKSSTFVTKSQFFSTYWWNINGTVYSLNDIISVIYGAQELQNGTPEDILNALTDASKASFTTTYGEINNGEAIPDTGSQIFYLSFGDLTSLEYKKLFTDVAKSAITSQDQSGGNELSVIATQKFDLTKENVKEGITPFIQLKEGLDLGFFSSFNANGQELNQKFPGAEFEVAREIQYKTNTTRY